MIFYKKVITILVDKKIRLDFQFSFSYNEFSHH